MASSSLRWTQIQARKPLHNVLQCAPLSASLTDHRGVSLVQLLPSQLASLIGAAITAAQAGDQSYKAAPNVVRSFEVINPELLHLPHLFGNK